MTVLETLRAAARTNGKIAWHSPGDSWHGEEAGIKTAFSEEGSFTVDGLDGVFEYVEGERTGYDFDYFRVILSYNNGEKYFSVLGSYSSWDGVDWEYPEVDEVEKVERVVSDWVTKKD